MELLVDTLFFIDISLTFISAYEDKDRNIEFRIGKIAYSYIKSWFLIDVVSSVPFQMVNFTPNSQTSTSQTSRILYEAGRWLASVSNSTVSTTT